MLTWQRQQQNLQLQGELTAQTLLSLWQQRTVVMQGVRQIDVSQLAKVDTAGLSLLLHFVYQQQPISQLTGIKPEFAALMTLCNVQAMLPVA